MKLKKILLLLFTLIIIVPSLAWSLNFEVDGYCRVRGFSFFQLDLNSDLYGVTRNYFDMRLRMEPTLTLNDYVAIRSTFDILDNTVFGEGAATVDIANNPSFFQTASAGNTVAPVIYEDPSLDILGFSGTQAGGAISVKRVWAEITTPLGVLRAGRQPNHFGLGMSENAGDSIYSDFGDIADRISFTTGYKGFVLGSGYDKEVEVDDTIALTNSETGVDSNQLDTTRWFFLAGYDKDFFKFLTFISTRRQPVADLKTWYFDVYAEYNYEWLKLQGEFLNVQGGVGSNAIGLGHREITAYNWITKISGNPVIRKNYKVLFGGETGFSSGTSNGPNNTATLRTIPFDKDYNVGYILFEESLPGGAGTDTLDTTNTNVGSASRKSGAVSNAIYWKLNLGIVYDKKYGLEGGLLNAWAMKNPAIGFDSNGAMGFASNKQYGTEYHFKLSYLPYSFLEYYVVWAHFFPGALFDDQQQLLFGDDNAENAYTVLGGVNIRF